jgi:acyl-lipid omega-6 desaturase (Delta-12 desaturase)
MSTTPSRLGAEARKAAAAFAQPLARQAIFQLVTSLGPFIAGCLAMYLVLPISWPLTLALALPTGALLVRVFIVQHDCGHGSFFASRRANAMVGRLCSLMTLTPYASWSRQHGQHHAAWNNLDRGSGSGTDMYSACLTVCAYRALTRRQRLLYRLLRHPLVANVLLPPLVFMLVYRLPLDTPRGWMRERQSVYFTNLALAGLFGLLVALVGWREVLLVHLPIMVVASILGIWLFSLQHRFETACWMESGDWSFVEAALHGSSWLRLPRPLQWLTGNIGFHHVHHLDPRVPNYRLREAHGAVQAICPVASLGVRDGLRALRLTLWDEAAGRLVPFRDAGPVSSRHAESPGRSSPKSDGRR